MTHTRCKLIGRMSLWWLMVLALELGTIALIDSTDSFQFGWLSLVLFPLGSFFLAKDDDPTWWFALYGLAGAAVNVIRLVCRQEFVGWWQQMLSRSFGTEVNLLGVLVYWCLLSAILAMLCWLAALLQRAPHGTPVPPQRNPLGLRHLLAGTFAVGVSLASIRELIASRQPFGDVVAGKFLLPMMGMSVTEGASLLGLAIFMVRRRRGLAYPTYLGEYLALALGIHTSFLLIARALFVLDRRYDLFGEVADAYWEYDTAGVILLTLVMLAGWRHANFVWRVMIAGLAILKAIECLDGTLFVLPFGILIDQPLRLTPAAMLVVIALIDWTRRRHSPWTHWLGLATMWWRAGFWLVYWVLTP